MPFSLPWDYHTYCMLYLHWECFYLLVNVVKFMLFFKHAHIYGFTNVCFTVTELFATSAVDMYQKVQSPAHYLHMLLPPKKSLHYSLRNSVPKKYTTQSPMIIYQLLSDSNNFWYNYYWVNMPLKGGLISHLTCLVYILYLTSWKSWI